MTSARFTQRRLALPLASLICLLGAWTLSAATPLQEPAPEQGAPSEEEQTEEEHTPLQLSMKKLRQGTKALRPLLRDFEANQTKIIEVIGSMEEALIEGLSQTPPRPEKEMTPSEWAQYETAFHQKIHASLGLALEMKLAAQMGEADVVIEASRNLSRGKKDGHGTYKFD